MKDKLVKLLRLFNGPDRLQRLRGLLEIRLNLLLFGGRPSDALTFDDLLLRFHDTELANLLQPGGEAEQAVLSTRAKFDYLAAERKPLPFPTYFNADKSLAMLCYALARYMRPKVVVETGVGYGITSALVLSALERNRAGQLISMDLPSLADPTGASTGMAVPERLRKNWTLYRGSSRRWLSRILKEVETINMLISDSSNVYTLQRHEFETVRPMLSSVHAVIFNNIGRKFQEYLSSIDNAGVYYIWQVEKTSCVTGLILNNYRQ